MSDHGESGIDSSERGSGSSIAVVAKGLVWIDNFPVSLDYDVFRRAGCEQQFPQILAGFYEQCRRAGIPRLDIYDEHGGHSNLVRLVESQPRQCDSSPSDVSGHDTSCDAPDQRQGDDESGVRTDRDGFFSHRMGHGGNKGFCENRVDGIIGDAFGTIAGNATHGTVECVRGPNYERNQRWKKERRLRKSKKQDFARESRNFKSAVQCSSSGGSVRSQCSPEKRAGFFSSCDESVRRDLRESRAKALIAKNELDAARDKRRLESQSTSLFDVLSTVKSLNELKRATKDTPIAGWAQTVMSTQVSSAINSARSSSPSLPELSISPDDSASFSGDKSGELKVTRMSREEIAYRIDLSATEKYLESLECVSNHEEYAAYVEIANRHPDVKCKYIPDCPFL